ncbi:DUF427 domain-containing protein [Segeticoccus rhizosphaerae]|jgi:uncharacterized protein (DUF427 family)|uniref:DUF427 domain-containing protein n=1 Tax=Segeticoccus rhizosphaerae TaxID=1104777 RepID=UPI0012652069|nr:DUF427 domain-containing protein [Segeticoccus rhizosphaerae]
MALKMRGYLMGALPQLRFEPTARRVRVRYGEELLVDTQVALLVWEPRRLVPVYAVPEGALQARLVPSGAPVREAPGGLPPVLGPEDFATHSCPGQPLDVQVGEKQLLQAAFRPSDEALVGYVLLDFPRFSWLEEAQVAVGHPHDPFKRIDTLRSDRHVQVLFDGVVLADTRRAVALLETHLPTRWYLPRADVRMELLEPSEHRSTCAYKGHASYFSIGGAGAPGEAIGWTYPDPLQDAEPVRDMICFFNERTDLVIDGVPAARPVTPWSTPEEQQRQFAQAASSGDLEFG